jgi:hypothetical protein
MMHLTMCKERFSLAYVRAVAAATGLNVTETEVDDDSVDLTISSRSDKGKVRKPRIDLQVKATAKQAAVEEDFSFPLSRKNYDDLRDEGILVPRILVVMLLPEDTSQWLDSTDERLLMRYCAYWASLRGEPKTDNTESVSVKIPRLNRFTVQALACMMRSIGQGGTP